ncbi:MAG: adenylate kinase [Proteobacteria bacterium]|nr:adenylate kinase [Pseudomonadota bacterium]
MDVVLFGPPGAGKGTQAEHICSILGITHVSTGDLFRNLDKDSEVGKLAKSYMDDGQLVPDDVTVRVLAERLKDDDVQSGVLLDGFPRTINQCDELEKWMTPRNRNIDLVIAFDITDKEIMRRLTNRRMCRGCGRSFHLIFVPPAVENVCDDCGASLYQRGSDVSEKIQDRIDGYYTWTLPMLEYLEKKEISILKIDGMGSPKAVSELLTNALKNQG